MSPLAIISQEEQYLSPLATTELVGREQEIARVRETILETIRRKGRSIIYITGVGGIGKTRLLQHLLKVLPQHLPVRVAGRPVDMYHTINHTVEGLIQALQEVLAPDGVGFERYQKERETLYRITWEERAQWQEQRNRMIQAFLEDLNRVSQRSTVVLALDTMERLFLQEDPVAFRLGIPTARSLVYDWLLKDFLPNVENTVVLLAGRPVPIPEKDLEKIGLFRRIDLSGLTEEETLEYFEKLASTLQASSSTRDQFVANQIQQWDEEFRRCLFHALRDNGTIRPILLALAIDYLAISGEPFVAARSLAEAQRMSDEERKRNQQAMLERVETLVRQSLYPLDAFDVMSWLRKGADIDLLTMILETERARAEEACEWARRLSFVKTRPADRRLFLHDEMYALLRDPREAIPAGIFRPLKAYYSLLTDQIRAEITEIYRKAEPGLPDLGKIFGVSTRLRDALTENLHYTLRHNALEGFHEYLRLAEEALSAGDEMLDIQLRAELLDFWRERDPQDSADAVNGLPRADFMADAAIRWVKRLIAAGRYEDAGGVIHRLREDAKDLIEKGGEVAATELDLAEALLLTYRGQIKEAETLLLGAKEKIEAVPSSERTVRWNILEGQLYNTLGYLRRVQGQFIAAAEMYWRALPYWRGLNMEAEQANTLTNLAFALMLRGEFSAARLHARDALGLRRKQGLPARVALTLNTLAGIEIYAGDYREAEKYALQALEIARQMQFPRGEGLAHLSLAACYRFMSEPPCPAQERVALLEKSLEHSQEALRIFSGEPQEPERLISAWYEKGIAHREFCRPPTLEGIDIGAHIKEAENALKPAMEMARQNGLWAQYLDGAMGLAWMYYYTTQENALEQHLQIIEREIQEQFASYLITPSSSPAIREDTVLGVFAQLARLHVLKGVQSMDAFERSEKKPPYPDLRIAAQEFALALEYDALIAKDFRDMRRAVRVIYERLKGLNARELTTIYDAVSELAEKFQRDREKWFFWERLHTLFGPYEVLSAVAV
ncbi:MAG: AAA family ATPase [Anaerolineae bacterium]